VNTLFKLLIIVGFVTQILALAEQDPDEHVTVDTSKSHVPPEKVEEAKDAVLPLWNERIASPLMEDWMFSTSLGYHGRNAAKRPFAHGLVCIDPEGKKAVAAVQVSVPMDPPRFFIIEHSKEADPFHFVDAFDAIKAFQAEPLPRELANYETILKNKNIKEAELAQSLINAEVITQRNKGNIGEWMKGPGVGELQRKPIISSLQPDEFQKILQRLVASPDEDMKVAKQNIATLEEEYEQITKQLEPLKNAVEARKAKLEKLRAPFESDIDSVLTRTYSNGEEVASIKRMPDTVEPYPFFQPLGTMVRANASKDGRIFGYYGPIDLSKNMSGTPNQDSVIGLIMNKRAPEKNVWAVKSIIRWRRQTGFLKGKPVFDDMICTKDPIRKR
jgi:hypothetical protein